MEAESALAGLSRGLLLRPLIERAWLHARWGRKDEELAVGEHAVDVEEEKLDFAGSGLSGELGHRVEF